MLKPPTPERQNRGMIDPSGLAARARARLREAADPRIARRARTYFKQDERVTFLGVATPGVREIEKGLFGEVKGVWKIDEAISFCDRLVTSPPMEGKNVVMFLLSRGARASRGRRCATRSKGPPWSGGRGPSL